MPQTASPKPAPKVLIVEDDASTRQLLELLIKRLWRDSRVETFAEVQSALDAWRLRGADLALVDLELPGIGGLALLEQIAKDPSKGTLAVIVSHHNDRAIVLQALRYRARDYIVKPFNARDVMQRLSALMQFATSDDAPPERTAAPTLDALVRLLRDAIGFRRLSVPIDPALVERIESWYLKGELDKARILEHWSLEPALVARVIGAANSGPYNPDGQPIAHLSQALDQLNPGVVYNLSITLALQPGNPLRNRSLRAIADELRACQHGLYRQFLSLKISRELGLAATACALYRIGELAILQLIQAWMEQGGTLSAAEAVELIERFGPEADDAIKSQWLIPRHVRDLSRAADELPNGPLNQTLLMMRIAGLQLDDGDPEEIARLRESAGLRKG